MANIPPLTIHAGHDPVGDRVIDYYERRFGAHAKYPVINKHLTETWSDDAQKIYDAASQVFQAEVGNANPTIEAISRLATALDKRFVLQKHPTVEP